MEDTFTLKCDAHAVKINYDSNDNISVIKIFPERNSDIKIAFGKNRVTISDEKLKSRAVRKQYSSST